MCKLWVIAEHALGVPLSAEARYKNQPSWEVIESTFGMLLEWVSALPNHCARSDTSTHHVMTLQ